MTMTDSEPAAGGSYQARAMNADLDKEIARLRTQVQWSWEKEARNLGWFGLRDGMAILEVGSGPGFVTEQLLLLCPTSHLTCVEIDPDLVAPAAQYLHRRGFAGRYTLIQGDLMQMPCPANAFDFVVARFVFQHLSDPAGALAEIHRVLKPGGTLVIHDVDTGLGEIYGPQDAAATALEQRLHAVVALRGGNPQIGRQLWRLLAAAGFVHLDLEACPVHTDKLGFETLFPDDWDPGAYKAGLDLGLLTTADLETLHQAHRATHAAPDKYALFVSLMVKGQKAL